MGAAGANGKPHRRWIWIAVLGALALSAIPIAYTFRMTGPATATASPPAAPVKQAPGVACLGRIEPEGGILHVAAPYLLGHPAVVKKLYVQEGQSVRRGALLALLEGRDQLEAAYLRAQQGVEVARRRLAEVQSGAKAEDLSAQAAEIERLKAAKDQADSEFKRFEALRATGDVTASELENRRAAMVMAQHALEAARHRLESLHDVPKASTDLAEAELQAALADAERARREFEASAVYAPADGQVLKIEAHEGEEAGPGGLLQLGRTGRMYVTAEVYETDIRRVAPGQHATISGDLLKAPIQGVVERLGMEVKAPSVVLGDPAEFSDNRIVEVKIRLEDSRAVAGLVGGKVSVVIHP